MHIKPALPTLFLHYAQNNILKEEFLTIFILFYVTLLAKIAYNTRNLKRNKYKNKLRQYLFSHD